MNASGGEEGQWMECTFSSLLGCLRVATGSVEIVADAASESDAADLESSARHFVLALLSVAS